MVSNWADFIKSDSTYQYIYNWHFIDMDSGLTKTQLLTYLQKDTATDVFTKTNFLIKELKNKQLSMDKKRMYLKLLIHFIGDIHQPFHVGRHEDLGGNKIKLTWFFASTNLHAIWDEQLINFQQLSYTEYTTAINHTTAKQRARVAKTTNKRVDHRIVSNCRTLVQQNNAGPKIRLSL